MGHDWGCVPRSRARRHVSRRAHFPGLLSALPAAHVARQTLVSGGGPQTALPAPSISNRPLPSSGPTSGLFYYSKAQASATSSIKPAPQGHFTGILPAVATCRSLFSPDSTFQGIVSAVKGLRTSLLSHFLPSQKASVHRYSQRTQAKHASLDKAYRPGTNSGNCAVIQSLK